MLKQSDKKKRKKKLRASDYRKPTTERRDEIELLMMEVGHPSLLNQSQLAKHYGVTRATISKDFKRIGEALGDMQSKKAEAKADLLAEAFYQGAIRNVLKGNAERSTKQREKAFKKARPYMRDYISFQFRRGRLSEKAKQLDLGGSVTVTKEATVSLSDDDLEQLADYALEKLTEKRSEELEEMLDEEEDAEAEQEET